MVAVIASAALIGFEGAPIEVETDARSGLPGMQIVGMGNKAIDEARERVRSAIRNSSLDFPARKYTINLAPAELPKDGTHLDVPIALGILLSSGQLRPYEVKGCLFAGELALNGDVRPIRGAIIVAEVARRQGYTKVFVPRANCAQAQLVEGVTCIGVDSLTHLFQLLKGIVQPSDHIQETSSNTHPLHGRTPVTTLDEIRGHEQAKRALIIAAAGRHNVLLSGPPGSGKTLLAKAFRSLLPPLTPQETKESTLVHSLAYGETGTVVSTAPFRSPHHSSTLTSLIGGGSHPKPGDISLAHNGVLLLDEFPEFSRVALEALRQPLEDKTISLSRVYGRVTYPADFLLIATMNPCPCGFVGSADTPCTCSPMQQQSYKKRISGPLLDRFDLRLTVSKVDFEQLSSSTTMQSPQQSKVLDLVKVAREQQNVRYKRSSIYNTHASPQSIDTLFHVDPAARKFAIDASKKLVLSARGFYRLLRVSRTIADLESSPNVRIAHVAEALQFR